MASKRNDLIYVTSINNIELLKALLHPKGRVSKRKQSHRRERYLYAVSR